MIVKAGNTGSKLTLVGSVKVCCVGTTVAKLNTQGSRRVPGPRTDG